VSSTADVTVSADGHSPDDSAETEELLTSSISHDEECALLVQKVTVLYTINVLLEGKHQFKQTNKQTNKLRGP
jgi:hypothetical protein